MRCAVRLSWGRWVMNTTARGCVDKGNLPAARPKQLYLNENHSHFNGSGDRGRGVESTRRRDGQSGPWTPAPRVLSLSRHACDLTATLGELAPSRRYSRPQIASTS